MIWASLAAVSCLVAIAACSSSHTPSSTAASRTDSQALAFAGCMRDHGVPSFPDPGAGGGGIDLAGAGLNARSPAFQSAHKACARLAPRGAPGGIRATESQFLAALRFAKCMRANGYPDFPDPTRADSPPGPILIVGQGMFFRVSPSFDPEIPPASRVVAACGRR